MLAGGLPSKVLLETSPHFSARFFNDREGKTEKASSHRQPPIWTSGPVLIGHHHYPAIAFNIVFLTITIIVTIVIVMAFSSEPDIHDRHSLVSQHLVNSSGGGSRVGSSRASSRSSHAHSQVKVKSINCGSNSPSKSDHTLLCCSLLSGR